LFWFVLLKKLREKTVAVEVLGKIVVDSCRDSILLEPMKLASAVRSLRVKSIVELMAGSGA
jgi:hypothetical protein